MKIAIAEPNPRNRESTVLRTIAAAHPDQLGHQHLVGMQDCFKISGPNGNHQCLVLELLGPSVADFLDTHCIERLPGTLVKSIAKQALLGLCFLHHRKIAHGGTHYVSIHFTFADHPQICIPAI